MKPLLGLLAAALALASCTSTPITPRAVHEAVATQGMVVSRSPLATDIGVRILEEGGNAVDAAVAVAFAMAVTWPEAGNIGGGGFMLVHPGPGKEPVFIDYRERAPALAMRNTFVNDRSALTHRAVGVPGTVAGLYLAHQRLGSLPWRQLVLPAVELAGDGFVVDEGLARSLNFALREYELGGEFRRVYGERAWQAGDRIDFPDLARVLRDTANKGPDGFYKGRTAEFIEQEMLRGGGLIRKADLAAYKAKVRKPIHTRYRGFDVWGAPPPSSGGICNALMLNMLEPMKLRDKGRYSLDTVHAMAEAMRRAFAERARHLGDPDFVSIPSHLTTKEHADKLRKSISFARATRSVDLAPDITIQPEGNATTHFSVLDHNGMAVSNTYTLEHSFGSRIVVRGAGFLLNNEMGDFNWRPGLTDHRGRIGTEPNTVAPGKRMLSSMSPTIVTKNGSTFLITGSPGGRTIINTVLCTLVNVLEFEMDLKAAVAAPRIHHQWLPDRLSLEDYGKEQLGELPGRLHGLGHRLTTRKTQGDVNAIGVLPDGRLRGIADPRHLGKAAGR